MQHDNEEFPDLTAREKLACEEFLKDLNGKQAMIRAGYSPLYADKRGYMFFGKDKIHRYLDWLRKKRNKSTGITPDEVVRRLMRIAEQAERDDEFGSALRALELLGKHMAMFTDKQIVKTEENPWATGDNPDAVKDDTERLMRVAAPKLKAIAGGKEKEE